MSGARHLRLIFVPYFQRFSITAPKNRIKYGIPLLLARGFATIHTIYDVMVVKKLSPSTSSIPLSA